MIRKGLMIILVLALLAGSVSATISNVHTEPAFPSMNSNFVKIYADISNVNYAVLYYQITGDTAINSTQIFSVPMSGKYAGIVNADIKDNSAVTYNIITFDSLGNVIDNSTHSFTYDGTNPVTTDNAPTFTNSDVLVTLTCKDSVSGCNQTYYSINDSNFSLYTSPITLSGAGSYQLKYYSIDNAGNTEITETGTLVQIENPNVSASTASSSSNTNTNTGNAVASAPSNSNSPPKITTPITTTNVNPHVVVTGETIRVSGQAKKISIILGILIVAVVGIFVFFKIKFKIRKMKFGI